ncbi:MAG: nuclease-related domain-containing protein [Marinoscillum sp.]
MWQFLSLGILIIAVILFQELRRRKLLKTVTSPRRGTRTERELVLTLLKRGIPAITIFHDLYVKQTNGKYSQIDVAVATKVGIIVFEVKKYNGWIFGDGRYQRWTQVLNYGKEKHRFYNPIKQNTTHILRLKAQLPQFENIPFYSVVVFYGNCELKDISFVPEGTWIVKDRKVRKVLKHILKTNEPAPYADKHAVVRVLREAVKNGENPEVQAQHTAHIKDMLGKHRIFD